MQIELKALVAALAAGVGVVGASYGVSGLVVKTQAAREGHKAAALTRAAQTPGAGAAVVNAAFVAQGRTFYVQSCASCHGADAGGGYGPSLHHEDMNDARLTSIINNGVKGKMPGFAGKYNTQQTQTLVAYIDSLK